MEKALLTKIVWLGAVLAIPVAVISLQKPEAHLHAESRRVIVLDTPVAIDNVAGEVAAPAASSVTRPADPPVAARPKPMMLGTEKIVMKGASAEATPTPAKDKELLPSKDQALTAAVGSTGPKAQ